jgi:penicillin-binding protein 2
MNLHDAVVQSCDVYFYKLAVAMEVDAMKKFLEPFGFGAKTGVDLQNESEGLLPSVAWKKARGQPWYPGETVITGIGQGSVLVTPLQLATATATLANHGVRLKPRLVRATVDAKTQAAHETVPETAGQIILKKKENLDIQIRNLMDVVHTNRGTAYGIGYNAPYKIAGKTGTAQVRGIAQGQSYSEKLTPERFRDHALFVSFAPVEDPKVAVAVIVENGGHGSSAAAPIARKIMDHVILGEAVATPGAGAAPVSENDE